MRNNTVTITGLIATTPRSMTTSEGLNISSFRLASTHRRYDKGTQKWVDSETNWFTVTCFRQLAINVARSANRGERVIVIGTLRIREWDNGEKAGTTVEVEAESVGHDLTWGVATLTRNSDQALPTNEAGAEVEPTP